MPTKEAIDKLIDIEGASEVFKTLGLMDEPTSSRIHNLTTSYNSLGLSDKQLWREILIESVRAKTGFTLSMTALNLLANELEAKKKRHPESAMPCDEEQSAKLHSNTGMSKETLTNILKLHEERMKESKEIDKVPTDTQMLQRLLMMQGLSKNKDMKDEYVFTVEVPDNCEIKIPEAICNNCNIESGDLVALRIQWVVKKNKKE